LFAGANDIYKDNDGSGTQFARLNYFGRANYNFKSKYMFEFVWRYDGSYKFPEGNQFGFFPGISAGWRISDENFWKNNISFINDLKIRGSVGRTGNDAIDDYQYLSSYGFTYPEYVLGGAEQKVMAELRIPNPNVTWEVANQANIGFEAKFLNKKLSLEADYFYNRRSDILWQRNASVPGSTGLILPPENIGKVDNQGFEYILSYQSNAGDFIYNFSFNGSYSTNKIVFWDETPGIPDYQKSTGYPMGAELYYQAIGVFRDQAAIDDYPHISNAIPGDIIFEDYNKDGSIDDLDRVRNDKTSTPRFTGGLGMNFIYKQFDLSLLFQGVAGVVNYYQQESGTWSNFLQEDFDGRWTEENPDASKPRAYNANIDYWILWNSNYNHTYWLRNSSYLRLKNAEIGYNLPNKLNNKIGISGFRIYVNGNNLLTFSKIKRTDPEMNANREFTYLVQRVINTGLVLTF
jgi:TonB-linked SusC/RagA family outer membrane protein